jgi:hypothetical protein
MAQTDPYRDPYQADKPDESTSNGDSEMTDPCGMSVEDILLIQSYHPNSTRRHNYSNWVLPPYMINLVSRATIPA